MMFLCAVRGGENGWFARAAPLLARCRRVVPGEAALESVEWDQRFKFPNPSLAEG